MTDSGARSIHPTVRDHSASHHRRTLSLNEAGAPPVALPYFDRKEKGSAHALQETRCAFGREDGLTDSTVPPLAANSTRGCSLVTAAQTAFALPGPYQGFFSKRSQHREGDLFRRLADAPPFMDIQVRAEGPKQPETATDSHVDPGGRLDAPSYCSFA